MKHQIYVTYGKGNKFNLDRIKLDLDLSDWLGKPACAWWGSPIDANLGWTEWCQAKKFIEDENIYFAPYNTIYWRLKKGAKILKINGLKDLEWCVEKDYIYRDISDPDWIRYRWNFTTLVRHGYAAIQLFDPCLGYSFTNELEKIMYRWDCESIVVLDPSMIIQLFDEKLNKVKWLYRLESKDPNNGLWYNTKGDYVWGCKDCKGEAKNLPMGYDDRYHIDGKNWFSSCSSKEDLLHWYSKEDAEYLLDHGFVFTRYLAKDYHEFQLETVFLKETAISRQEISFKDLF